jgi:hypothetical protein
MSQPRCKEIALLAKQRLLITESTAEFDPVRRALEQEIGPPRDYRAHVRE